MRDIPQEIIDALDDGVVRPVIFVEIAFDLPLRFTSLTESFTLNGAEYVGAGNLGSISDPTENKNLDPQQIEIKLAGIKDEALSIVGRTNYLNRDVTVLWGLMDDQGNLLGGTTMVRFIGKTDEVKFNYGQASFINITARDKLADWSRARIEKNTNAEQQARFPGDKGFEFAGQVADKKIIWPKGEYYE